MVVGIEPIIDWGIHHNCNHIVLSSPHVCLEVMQMNDFPNLPPFNNGWTEAMRIAWLTAWGQGCANYKGPRPIIIQNKVGEIVFDGWANVYDGASIYLHKTEANATINKQHDQCKTIRVRLVRVEEEAT